MNALELILAATGSAVASAHPRHSSRLHPDYDPLEPRQLLSGAQASTSSRAASVTPAIGEISGAGASLGQVGAASTVVTQAVGDINNVQSQLPINDVLANVSLSAVNVAVSPGPISVATDLPISTLIQSAITENETPLNNGTPIIGTVWITEAPEPSGIFHFGVSLSPVLSDVYLQTVNPQGGPPSSTHFGADADGNVSGVAIEEPLAVGPLGSSITIEIRPVQPPSVEAEQMFGPPPQIQPDEITARQGARTPGGQQQPARPKTPGQATVPGQQGTISAQGQRSVGEEPLPPEIPVETPSVPEGQGPQTAPAPQPPAGAPQGVPAPQPPAGQGPQVAPGLQPQTDGKQVAPGAEPQTGGKQGAPGPEPPTDGKKDGPPTHTGGSGGGAAFLIDPRQNRTEPVDHQAVALVDAAIPSLVSESDHATSVANDEGRFSVLLGAAAVAVGGFRLELR
jgi:hypothetical protein